MSETPPTLTQPPAPNPGTPPPATPPAPGTPPPTEPPNPFRVADWQQNETLRDYEKQLGKFTDPETGALDLEKLGKSYGELERYKGGPAPDPITQEQFTQGIGQAEIPEGVAYPDEMRQGLATLAHEKGIDPETFRELESSLLGAQKALFDSWETAQRQQGQADFDALTQEVGPAKIDAYVDNAKRAAETLGFELDTNDRTPERVAEIRAFAHIAEKIGEATLPTGGTPAGGSGGLSDANEIRTNPANPYYEAYHNPSHPQHEDAHAHHDRLLYEATKRNPGQTTAVDGGKI